jgi:hypothetical protein
VKPMARQPFRDPLENSFEYWVPRGWSASGGAERNLQGGVARKFAARKDALGLIQAGVPGLTWTFAEGPLALWGTMAGIQAMRYMPAAQFAAQWYVPQAQRGVPGLGVASIQDRPDLLPYLAHKLAQEGTPAANFELSVAEVVTTYVEGGVGLKQRTRIAVARPRAGLGPMGSGWWMASPDFIRAPETEFDIWEPVLAGILDSGQFNPAGVPPEQRRQPNFFQPQYPISPTLPGASDLFSGSYWRQPPAADQDSPTWSNANAGYPEAPVTKTNALDVPAGYEQYWRDGLNTLYGGSWPANPDPTWERLEPTF